MKKKVMFVASSGGHLSELLKLETLFNKYDYLLVTEKVDTTEYLKDNYNVKYVSYCSRDNMVNYYINILINLLKSIYIYLKFRPDTIVTTGANTGGVMCFIGKMFGSKIIYIESLAKVKDLSLTGKNMYKIADKFYVQWEELTKLYDKAEYLGRLI
ncbi:MAG: UDP-N-acetylglucosamine transferase subunit ALG14 [Clostridia bacterium]|nr:UDP-N-acetylglucosamine transferase subunit ALG14 [Clostridia bacterium]